MTTKPIHIGVDMGVPEGDRTVYRTVQDRVVVRRAKATRETEGLLITVDESRKTEGVVLAVGPGLQDKWGNWKPMTVKVGDKVLFTLHAGNRLQGDIWVMREAFIQAVI